MSITNLALDPIMQCQGGKDLVWIYNFFWHYIEFNTKEKFVSKDALSLQEGTLVIQETMGRGDLSWILRGCNFQAA